MRRELNNQVNTVEEKKETRVKRLFNAIKVSIMSALLFLSNGFYVSAGEYGKNAGEWIMDQLFWIAIVFVVGGLVGCVMKKNWSGAITTVLGGAVILYFISNPTVLSDIGGILGGILTNG